MTLNSIRSLYDGNTCRSWNFKSPSICCLPRVGCIFKVLTDTTGILYSAFVVEACTTGFYNPYHEVAWEVTPVDRTKPLSRGCSGWSRNQMSTSVLLLTSLDNTAATRQDQASLALELGKEHRLCSQWKSQFAFWGWFFKLTKRARKGGLLAPSTDAVLNHISAVAWV